MFKDFLYQYWWLTEWDQIGTALGIFILFHIFRKLLTKFVLKLLFKVGNKKSTELFRNIFVAFERPLRLFFIGLGFYISLMYLPLHEKSDELIIEIYRSFMIFLIGYGLFNLSASTSVMFTKVSSRFDVEVDEILLPFLSKIVRVGIVALMFSIIISDWGYDVNGFVAGLGIGGLAFALAAKDALANLFGGVVIITEKPFTIGDWIKTPSVEGTVEGISFRSTKIRTFADAIVTVPNSTLSNDPITNWSKMGKRRISFNLAVTYTTPKDKLEVVVRKIEELLRNNPDVDQELIFVRFDQFNDSSLDIFLYFFTKTTAWGEFLEVKEKINFKIMGILEEEGVSVAFPSRSIYIEKKEIE